MRRTRARDLPEPAPAQSRPRPERHPRGQSLVEFALVLPMLLILLLGIADFARVFSAGITLEAAARNAAEAAAQEYTQIARNKSAGLDANDYARLHQVAMDIACDETSILPVPDPAMPGSCPTVIAAICIHDGGDLAGCGSEASGAPADCPRLTAPWDDTNNGPAPGTADPLAYAEVRVCHRFETLFNLIDLTLPFGWGISLGDFYLERDRAFTVANY